jgi:hypothetical protein
VVSTNSPLDEEVEITEKIAEIERKILLYEKTHQLKNKVAFLK